MAGCIVFGADDSACAETGLAVATQLAADLSVRLVVVRMVDEDSSYPARVAREQNAELLVVCSRARRRWRAAVAGSVSAALERSAPCPLVVVPSGAEMASSAASAPSVTSIVCGIADPDGDVDLVDFAANLARRVRARLEVVHVDSGYGSGAVLVLPTEAAAEDPLASVAPLRRLRSAMDLAEAHGVPARARLTFGTPARALEHVAQRESARMIVVGTRCRGLLSAIVQRSVGHELAASGSIPVLMRPHQQPGGGAENASRALAKHGWQSPFRS